MQIHHNHSLQPYNTFGIHATARVFAVLQSPEEYKTLLQNEDFRNAEHLILGGGSNMLLLQDWPGWVLKVEFMGRELLEEDADTVLVAAGAGEVWHEWVMHCVQMGWGGIENLSLIPGCVGAAPIQNIGAYGVEIKDVFAFLEAIDLATGELRRFGPEECQFGYRDSVFKREEKGKYLISRVAFRLSKQPVLNTSYGAIEQELAHIPAAERTIRDVSEAVIRIRRSKLPDPAEIGNAGSFFKNPEIPKAQYEALKAQYPTIPGYPGSDAVVKVPAGWLIEQAGWKGKRLGNYGVHVAQALVLVNYGGAKGRDIYQLSEDILASILEKYGIALEREVNMIG